jgi:hypothetical protein
MIRFLAHLIEQLDFALDHLVLDDINYKRVSLMLIDNVVELALHNFADERNSENRYMRDKSRNDAKAVAAALGQHFEPKVKLANACGLLDDKVAATVIALHAFRNQLQHRGIMHEHILPALSVFYFRVACDVLSNYRPTGYGWNGRERMPLRAIKYVGNKPMGRAHELFPAAWARLKEASESIPLRLVEALHEHMKETIEYTDEMIDFLATGGPQKSSRDAVVVDSQAWGFAFTDAGKEYARTQKCPADTVGGYVDWIAANYPWQIRTDPIPSWTKRLSGLKTESDEHTALRKYTEFMSQTEPLRNAINESATQLDMHIEQQIERAREL